MEIENDGKRTDDYDFKECMKYAPWKDEDIADIIACVPGESDGPDWHYLCRLKDGKFGYVHAGCDYTGWGCQEGGDGVITDTLAEILEKIPDTEQYNYPSKEKSIRGTIKAQVEGREPYGVTTIEK